MRLNLEKGYLALSVSPVEGGSTPYEACNEVNNNNNNNHNNKNSNKEDSNSPYSQINSPPNITPQSPNNPNQISINKLLNKTPKLYHGSTPTNKRVSTSISKHWDRNQHHDLNILIIIESFSTSQQQEPLIRLCVSKNSVPSLANTPYIWSNYTTTFVQD
ncbi:hypothetical protein ACTA71_003848 [Dictyostelium dimigraforme]